MIWSYFPEVFDAYPDTSKVRTSSLDAIFDIAPSEFALGLKLLKPKPITTGLIGSFAAACLSPGATGAAGKAGAVGVAGADGAAGTAGGVATAGCEGVLDGREEGVELGEEIVQVISANTGTWPSKS